MGAVVTARSDALAVGPRLSVQAVVLDPHGGELNGFVLLAGTRAKLDAVRASDEFISIMVKASALVLDVGVVTGVTGDSVVGRIAQFMAALPKR